MTKQQNSAFPPLFSAFQRGGVLKRAHPRHACRMAAELEMPEKALVLEGMLLEISRSGALFREASRYILDRRGAKVSLHVAGLALSGSIVNVLPMGYGIRLDQLVDEADLGDLLRMPHAA